MLINYNSLKRANAPELLTVAVFLSTHFPDISRQTIYDALNKDLLDYTEISGVKYIVMNDRVKSFSPRPDKRRGSPDIMTT